MGISTSQDLATGQVTVWLAGTRVTLTEQDAIRLQLAMNQLYHTRDNLRVYRDMMREAALND